MLIGIVTDPLWRKNYERLVRGHEAEGNEPGSSEPEFRLPPTILGAVLVPVALFGLRSRVRDRSLDLVLT